MTRPIRVRHLEPNDYFRIAAAPPRAPLLKLLCFTRGNMAQVQAEEAIEAEYPGLDYPVYVADPIFLIDDEEIVTPYNPPDGKHTTEEVKFSVVVCHDTQN